MQENEFDDLFSQQLNRLPPPEFSERDWREVENQLIIKKLQKRLTMFGWALPLLGVASMAISGGLYYQLRQTHRELEQLKNGVATAKIKSPVPNQAPPSLPQVQFDTRAQRVAARLPDRVLPARQRTIARTTSVTVPNSNPVFTNSVPLKITPFDTTTTPQLLVSTLPELRTLTPQNLSVTPITMPLPRIQSPISPEILVPQPDMASTSQAVYPTKSTTNRPLAVPTTMDQKKIGPETTVLTSTGKNKVPDLKVDQTTVSNRRKNRRKSLPEGIDRPTSTPETTLAGRTGLSGSASKNEKKIDTPQWGSTQIQTVETARQEPPKDIVAPRDTSGQVAKVTQAPGESTLGESTRGESTRGTIRKPGEAAPFSFKTILKFTSVGLQVGLPASVGYGLSPRRGTVVGFQAGVRVSRHWQVFADVSSQTISPEINLKRPIPSIPEVRPNRPDFNLERFRVNNLKFTNVGVGVNFLVTDRFVLQPYLGLGWNLQVPKRYEVEFEFRHRPHRPPMFIPNREEQIIFVRDRFKPKGVHQVRLQGGLLFPVRDFLSINLEGFWNTQGRKTPTITDTSGLRLGISYRF